MKSIEYADESWNPSTGCIPNKCAVQEKLGSCWAARMAYRLRGQYGYNKENPFEPTFHEDKLNKPYRWKLKPRRIACCFMGDLAFAKPEWINAILKVIQETPEHRYYIPTKKPQALQKYNFPPNVWVGTTINRQQDLYRLDELKEIKAKIHFGFFEPLYEYIDFKPNGLDWIVIGSQTQPNFQPKIDWIIHLLAIADVYNIPIFMKNNLEYEPKQYNFPELKDELYSKKILQYKLRKEAREEK